ncbi:signal transduction histidine kinase [Thermocatellispora tengchongensis]|uniref:histidine kinase n=1 Tax=Thermocatellispora tengchongensis TaxID=1073253 RepID=A0A840P8I3_9ACTN|nr:histidine kinase [Thermocatellispora tengchongensis]MBB5133750.1 signal transduction histidine kinase [Thermocatellispora tengchongensis]
MVVTPRRLLPAGLGLLTLLVGSSWAQTVARGCDHLWPFGGGVALVVLCLVMVRTTPGRPAEVAGLLAPAAIAALTGLAVNSVGWFVLVLYVAFVALTQRLWPGVVMWLASLSVVVAAAFATPDPGWPNWLAALTLVFWSGWAMRYRIEVGERLHRAENAATAAAALAERQRLAADLHDIVAHTLAVTVLHLGGVRLALQHDPKEAAAGIAEAERLARQSMAELRTVVRVLAEEGSDPAVVAPQPTAPRLPELFEEYRTAGLELKSSVDGELSAVSPTNGMVLYRLVQETLANASRHAPRCSVEVRLRISDEGAVRATVTNPLPDRLPRHNGGMGLRAMADRVRMVGGHVTAGPEDDRWVVRTELPA